VGTVDKFQGQEAPVVIISLACSSFEGEQSSSKSMAFVLDIRRLNVALSRAQCIAIVVMSPALAETAALSLSQMRELSFACRIIEESDRP
jgi:uncharacterized protein